MVPPKQTDLPTPTQITHQDTPCIHVRNAAPAHALFNHRPFGRRGREKASYSTTPTRGHPNKTFTVFGISASSPLLVTVDLMHPISTIVSLSADVAYECPSMMMRGGTKRTPPLSKRLSSERQRLCLNRLVAPRKKSHQVLSKNEGQHANYQQAARAL